MENNIGDARRSYALAAGKFTQDDAAAFFGVASSTYRRWEQGIGMLNGVQLSAIADKYGVSTDYLLCRTQRPEPRVDLAGQLDPMRAELLRCYTDMNADGRERLVEEAQMLAESGRYSKQGAASQPPQLRATA